MSTENKLVIICSDESKWKWHSATIVKNKPNTIIDGSCIHCAVEQLKAENTKLKGDYSHLETVCAVKSTEIDILKAVLKESKDSWQKERLSAASYQVIDDLNSEITALKLENERLNKLAEGILAREESISAEHKLRIEIESENAALKSNLKIARHKVETLLTLNMKQDAEIQQLKAENEKLKYLLEYENRTFIENQEITALKSKLEIASAALEVVKVHNGINIHYPILHHTVSVALSEIEGEI